MSSTEVRWPYALAGLVAGGAGAAVSHALTMLMGVRANPVVAVAEAVIVITPGALAEALIQVVGQYDKPLLVAGVTLGLLALAAWAGLLARRSLRAGLLVLLAMGAVGTAATLTRPSAGLVDVLPVLSGTATWLMLLTPLIRVAAGAARRPAHDSPQPTAADVPQPTAQDPGRRRFLLTTGAVAVAALGVAAAGELVGRARRTVEQARTLLRLPATHGRVPDGSTVDVPGMPPWRTRTADFYRIDTALVVPAIDPMEWRLRIHGMVENGLVLHYRDLLERDLTESWVTLCCVSNEVGGDLIDNAWWSGVRIADLLAEAGVSPDADAVLQTSHDGWNCGTPLSALTDDRNALLAIAMNGEPLPVEHGFPVRMVVPGLYGYVSATKWLVDLEVTRFDRFTAYWTARGWAPRGPVKTQSRIDVPRSGADLPAGRTAVGGTAWAQHTGIARVEYQLDGGAWREAELGAVEGVDTWVQWRGEVDLAPGRHTLAVRATDRSGATQTAVRQGVVPDGATGWHTVDFRAG